MHTVAEGVEDQETAQVLTDIGVDVQQGFWFARPMPQDELRAWIRKNAHGASTVGTPSSSTS